MREAVAGYRARSFAAELERSRAALTAAGVDLTVTGVPAAAGDAYPPAVDELLAWAAARRPPTSCGTARRRARASS